MTRWLANLNAYLMGQTSADLLPTLARVAFAAVLAKYFLGSAVTKIDFNNFLWIAETAYMQIVPNVIENYGYDFEAVPFWPYGAIVALGTYGELVLPVLIICGLFTRIAVLGMVVFILVQTYVDVFVFELSEQTIGTWFDRFPNAEIADQRTLWIFLMITLFALGPGRFSLDRWLKFEPQRQDKPGPTMADIERE